MKLVAAIGLVLFQASLHSCRTHNSVSLAQDASAEVSVVSPTKASKLTQLIPILESLDSPDTKITKIKRLIPIYSELNKWKIRNKKQLVEILPLKKKGKPLAFILSGQPSYGTNERRGKQNGAGAYELSSSEETKNDSEEWNRRRISDHHTDIHESHPHNLHKNHSNHSHKGKSNHENNSLEQLVFVANSKNGESKHNVSKSKKSDAELKLIDDILQNSLELHHGHHSNQVYKKSYLDFDSHSHESVSNSIEADSYRHLKQPVQHHTHTVSPKHAYHQEVANFYFNSNKFENNVDSTESGPLELYQRQSHISKHHPLKNNNNGSDSVSDSDESDSADSVLFSIELESNEETLDSVSDSSSESNEFSILSDVSESDIDSDSISNSELYESNLNNSNNKKFDLHLYSETSESISDSKLEELFESDLISDPIFTESNRTINSNSDDSSGDYSKTYLKSHVLVGSDSESTPYLISSEFPSGSQSASSETLFETSESALSIESNFDSSASISTASVLKLTESHSKTTESFPESWSDESSTSDSTSQSSETNVASRTSSKVTDFISESQVITESSESGLESSESGLESSESGLESSESALESSESALESSESTLGSSESNLGSSESALESSESNLGSSESNLGSSESALEFSQSAFESSESTLGSSESTLDNSKSAHGSSESNLGSSESAREFSQSTLGSSESTLDNSKSALGFSESNLGSSDSTFEASESSLETNKPVSKINESSSKYSESNESSESVFKTKSASESNESEFNLESSVTSSEPCQTKLNSKESFESEVSQLQTSPQITDSRRHNQGSDCDLKSLDLTPCNSCRSNTAQKEERKFSGGKKTYRLSFVFNK